MLGALASQWTSASRQTIATATAKAKATTTSTVTQPPSTLADENSTPPDVDDDTNTTGQVPYENAAAKAAAAVVDEYCVVFTEMKLGLTLQRYKGLQLALVEAIKTPPALPSNSLNDSSASAGQASTEVADHAARAAAASAVEGLSLREANLPVYNAPSIGDVIIAVGGDYVTRCNYETTIDMLRTAPRPLVITFRKPHFLEETNAANATPNGSRMGSPLANSRHHGGVGSGGNLKSSNKGSSNTDGSPLSLSAPVSLLPGPGEMDVEVFDRQSLDGLSLARGGGDGNTLVLKSTEAYMTNWRMKQQNSKSTPLSSREEAEAASATQGEVGATLDEAGSLANGSTRRTTRLKKTRGSRSHRPVLPRCGAVLVAIDGKSIQGFGFDQAVATLLATNASPTSDANASNNSNNDNRNSQASKKKLMLRFREVETWAPRDTLSVSFAGLQFLAIDDCGGFRDLPLLKVGCGSVSATADLGTGRPWRWLNLRPHVRGLRLLVASHDLVIEYFNRRIGCWEPLLEPCDLRLDLEAEYRPQEGIDEGESHLMPSGTTSNERTTQGNKVADDDDGISGWFRGDVALRASTSGAVSVNVTEAALELLVNVAAEWETASAAAAMDKTSEVCAENKGGNSTSSGNEDATTARIASLAAPSRKPFVFHNATGHDMTFTLAKQHTQASSSSSSSFDEGTTTASDTGGGRGNRRTALSNRLTSHSVAAGAALPFSLDDRGADPLSAEGFLVGSGNSSYGGFTSHADSVHRSHDSSPPLVQVTFADNAFAAITNLPIGRVGVRRATTVAIRNTPLLGSFATTTNSTASSASSAGNNSSSGSGGAAAVPIPLLWEVVLLDGQHHLTLRSAIAVQNNTGSPLEASIPNYAVGREAPGYAWQFELAPAQVVSLPLTVAHAAHLVLKPKGSGRSDNGGASTSSGGSNNAPSSSSGDCATNENNDEFEWSDSVFSGATAAALLTSPSRVKGSVVCRRRNTSGQPSGSSGVGSGLSLPFKWALTPSNALPPCPALLPTTITSLNEVQEDGSNSGGGDDVSTFDDTQQDDPTYTSTSVAGTTTTGGATSEQDLAAATSNMPQCPWAMTLHVHPTAALRSLLPTPLEWSMRSDFSAVAGSSGNAARVVQFLGNGTLKPASRTWLPQVDLKKSFLGQPYSYILSICQSQTAFHLYVHFTCTLSLFNHVSNYFLFIYIYKVGDLSRTEVQICLPNGLSHWSDWVPLSNIVAANNTNTTAASSFTASLGSTSSPLSSSSSSPNSTSSSRLRIPLRDNADGVLCICAELDTRQGYAPTVVFFSEFWLRNLSSLPLVYGTFLAPPSTRSIGAIGGINSGSSSSSSSSGTGRAAPSSTTRNASMYPGAATGDPVGGAGGGDGRGIRGSGRWKCEVGGMANALEVIGGSDAWCAHAAWQDPSIPVVEELFEVVVRESMSDAFNDTLARKKRVRTRLLMHGGDLLSTAASNAAGGLRGGGGQKAVDERLPGPGFRFLHWWEYTPSTKSTNSVFFFNFPAFFHAICKPL